MIAGKMYVWMLVVWCMRGWEVYLLVHDLTFCLTWITFIFYQFLKYSALLLLSMSILVKCYFSLLVWCVDAAPDCILFPMLSLCTQNRLVFSSLSTRLTNFPRDFFKRQITMRYCTRVYITNIDASLSRQATDKNKVSTLVCSGGRRSYVSRIIIYYETNHFAVSHSWRTDDVVWRALSRSVGYLIFFLRFSSRYQMRHSLARNSIIFLFRFFSLYLIYIIMHSIQKLLTFYFASLWDVTIFFSLPTFRTHLNFSRCYVATLLPTLNRIE